MKTVNLVGIGVAGERRRRFDQRLNGFEVGPIDRANTTEYPVA
jgi:hypothetical protein